jgi:endonuclease/exonuclease/phosphatase family metal-dependent hydrolase
MQLKFATYNIHACIGTDGHFDPFRIASVINELDADVIALQEVEHHLVNDVDLLDFLAQQTDMIGLAGPTMFRETRHYGNAILTRAPVSAHKLIDVSLQDHEPRGVIQVTLNYDNQLITVYATHLGLKPAERRYQVQKLLALFESETAGITVLVGDLNEWFLWGRPLRWLKSFFSVTPSRPSFPSYWPFLALDWIWVSPRQHLLKVSVHQSELAKKASDHLPVIAEISL